MFFGAQFRGNIGDWNVSKVTNMREMFNYSDYDGNVDQ
jgi:hypothetical protein